MATNFRQEGKRIAYPATAAKVSGQVVVIGEAIGVCLADIAKDVIGSVALEGVWTLPKGNEVLAQGVRVYWDADGNPYGGVAGSGCITATAAGNVPAGMTFAAAGATAPTVDVKIGMPWAAVDTDASAVDVADAAGHFTGSTAEAALAEVGQHMHSAKKTVLISLGSLTLADGTRIDKFVDGASATPGFSQENGKELVLRWNNHATPSKASFSIPLPQDLDDAANLKVIFAASMSGATDTPALEHAVYINDGDTDCAGADPEVSGAARAEYTGTVLAADVPAPPGEITVAFGPKAGELGTDDLLLRSVRLEYTGKTLTA